MECNKEDAIRAKEIAENKMQNGDFAGARRIALKAQQLYPNLDNISQLLMVCEVHSSAQNKLNGSEMDWYGILQIEHFSGETVVKKQYKRLALSLHPDKNKFAGAEAAFKLICEANRVLTDPTKRSLYDTKCRVALRSVTPKSTSDQSSKKSYVKKQQCAANKFSNSPHSQFMSSHTCQQPQQTTFWTHCPYCSVKYQYYREFVNKMLRCQRCQQPFIANDLGVSPGSSWNLFPNEKRVSNQGPSEVTPQNAGKPSAVNFARRFSESDTIPKVGKAADVCGDSKPKEEAKIANASRIGGGSKPKEEAKAASAAGIGGGSKPKEEAKAASAAGIGGGSKQQEKLNGHVEAGKGGVPMSMLDVTKSKESRTSDSASSKRQRKSVEESSENFEDNGDLSTRSSRPSDGYQPRRSSRQKQHVTYRENLSDDDFVDPLPKRFRGRSSSTVVDGGTKETSAGGGVPKEDISAGFATCASNRNDKEVEQKATSSLEERSSKKKRKTRGFEAKGDESVTSAVNNDKNSRTNSFEFNPNETLKTEIYVCPDPNFSNFEKDRAEKRFAANQVWAIYDSIDGMPRFYARVRKVITPGFKLQITWLEASPDNKAKQRWCDEGLPAASGCFENGETEEIVDRLMFSHQMYCMNAGRRGTYLIYPKKGETWALFKDWDIKWMSEPDKHRPPYQYEFVVVLTDFTKDVGIEVAYLDKVKGFVSIYRQASILSFCIESSELYRFSHRIPSYRMTGQEGGTLAGSFELDTAALPCSLYNLVDLDDVKIEKEKLDAEAIGLCSKSSEHEVEPVKGSENVCTTENLNSGARKRGSALARSSGESTGICRDDIQIDSGQEAKDEHSSKVAGHSKLTQSEGINTSFHATEKSGTPEKQKKCKFAIDASTPRRSPRDLRLSNRINASRSIAEVADKRTATNHDDNERHGQPGASSCQHDNKMHLHVKDRNLVIPTGGQKSPGCRVIEVEHYDFKKEISEDKFQLDQIWAVQNNKDGLPSNYAQVKKIESATGFKLHVAMLEACPLRKDMQSACGTFKVKNKSILLPVTAFSHQVKAKLIGKNIYEVYPRRDEIWAMYKIWSAELIFSDKDAVGCDIVEVVADDESGVKVVVLMPVNGSKSFYMAPRRLKSGIIDIPRAEFGRFSHQCLASQVMGMKDIPLRGYWELAPSSIPGTLILVD